MRCLVAEDAHAFSVDRGVDALALEVGAAADLVGAFVQVEASGEESLQEARGSGGHRATVSRTVDATARSRRIRPGPPE